MRKSDLFFMSLIFLLSFLLMTGLAEEKVTIAGVVQAVDWDENDEVIAVSITVTETQLNEDGEEEEYTVEYYVDNDEMGQRLLELVGRKISATGIVSMDEDDNYTIHVEKYKVTD